jgi:hypothetical protein
LFKHLSHFFISFYFRRLMNRDAVMERERFNRRRMKFVAATCGLIGLSEDGGDLVTVEYEPLKRRNGEFRRAHENQFHSLLINSSAEFFVKSGFNLRAARLSPDR